MNTSSRTLISIICGVIVVLLLTWTMPTYRIEPRGIILPSQPGKTPTTGEVAVYDQFTAPFSIQKLGFISVMYHTPSQSAEDQQVIVNAAKEMARKAGANGIVISLMGHTLQGTPAPMAALVLRGEVIAVDGKS